MFWLILIVIIICIIMSNKKSTISEPRKLPSPWDSVKYVKMIYKNIDGSIDFTSILEVNVQSGGTLCEYKIFIDQSSFVNKMLDKSFVLLDENKNQIPIPSHYWFSYDEGEGCGWDAGFIYFYKKV